MKFGYLIDFRNPPGSGIEFAELYAEMFRQIEFIEAAGFDSVWLTEHHFTDDGYMPAIMPALAAVAARTRRITIGTYVLLTPFYHPLRLAEDAAVIDVIQTGDCVWDSARPIARRSSRASSCRASNAWGGRWRPSKSCGRAWTGERFSFAGKYFNFNDVRVLPRPVSRPHPELLWGGMTAKAIERGAELGLSFACNLGSREIAVYQDRLRQLGKDPNAFSIVNNRVVYVADSADQAWSEIEPALMYQAELYGKWLSEAAGSDQNWIVPDAVRLRKNRRHRYGGGSARAPGENHRADADDGADHHYAATGPRARKGHAIA
jgi:alkanesulfonate monooxygenase SsuD/methylene tetrahydromethanopterin reductase-like flavin-dependent oxidoreductase (luciferase family)